MLEFSIKSTKQLLVSNITDDRHLEAKLILQLFPWLAKALDKPLVYCCSLCNSLTLLFFTFSVTTLFHWNCICCVSARTVGERRPWRWRRILIHNNVSLNHALDLDMSIKSFEWHKTWVFPKSKVHEILGKKQDTCNLVLKKYQKLNSTWSVESSPKSKGGFVMT